MIILCASNYEEQEQESYDQETQQLVVTNDFTTTLRASPILDFQQLKFTPLPLNLN